jgi:hypothetical protein
MRNCILDNLRFFLALILIEEFAQDLPADKIAPK